MKIMIVTPYFYPKIGGLENYALNIAKGLKKEGHDVFIVTSNHESKECVERKVQGLKVIRLPYQIKLSNTPISLKWKQQIKEIIKNEKPDVINAYTPVPFIADIAERASGNTPFVLSYANDLVKSSFLGSLLARTYNFLFTRKTLRSSNSIVALSEYYVEASPYLKKYKDKISVVSPGVDFDRFNTKADKAWLRKKYPGKIIVLFVGGMQKTHRHKAVDTLIKAVVQAKKNIPNIQLVCVGSGDAIPIYKQLAKALGVADIVDFTGFVPDKDLPKYYAGADVFVLPSTTDAEGFGMVLAEAMACGTPVIGTKVGGVPFVVQHQKTGLLVKPNSSTELAKALVKIVSNPLLQKSLCTSGVASVEENFFWDKQIKKLDDILQAQSKQIVCIIATYPPKLGGMEFVAKALNNQLAQVGQHVRVITSSIGATPGDSIEENISVTRLRAKEIASTPLIPALFGKVLTLPRDSIIHIHVSQALIPEITYFAAKLRRFPVVIHMHTDVGPSTLAGKLLPIYKKFFLGVVLRRADKVIALNDSYKDLLIKKYNLPDNVSVISNGIHESFFNKKMKSTSDNTFRLLYVGRLTIEKNLPLIIEAVSKVDHNIQLDIVGDGHLLTELKRQAAQKKQKVTFHGRKSPEELVQLYNQADALILASNYEGQPTVIMEAMANGTPVIGADVIGIRDTVGDAGILVEKTPEALTEAITKLASDTKLRQKLSEKSKKRAENFHWEKSIQKLQKVYEEL